MISFGKIIVLDSCVILHSIRNNDYGKRIEENYHLSARGSDLLISSVCFAEVLAFARYQNWSKHKLERFDQIVSDLVVVNAGDSIVIESYVELYISLRKRGRVINQNDLWIAATARAVRGTLLTSDKDYRWLDPESVDVVIV